MGNETKASNAISADERMREIYRAREKARLDHIASINSAKRKGIEEGVKKTAKNLIELGVSTELVMEATGLTRDEIEEIQNS